MKYAKKNQGAIQKNKQKITTSRQSKKLIFGIPPYLTQLNEICKNNTDWGAIKK
jgi:ribosomal protein S17E